MISGRMLAVLLHACVLLAACAGATPEELLSEARAAIAAGQLRTAEIHLKNLLQLEGDNGPARELLGNLLLQRGDFTGAEQNLTLALELGADTAAVELSLLRTLVAQLKFNEALGLIENRGLPRNNSDAVAVGLLRGAVLRGLNQAESAVEAYREVLASNPIAPDLRTELASTLVGLGRVEEGRAVIAAILSDDPNYAPALLLRGGIEAAEGQRTAAAATFQQVVDLEQTTAARTERYSLAMAQLIEMQIALGQVDEAAANADALLARDERNVLARHAKALVEVQQDDLAGAERRLEALIAEAPRFWPAHRVLGAINIRQNQLGQAAMYLRAAVTNNPTDNAARIELAALYIREGDLAAARALMEGSALGDSDALFLAFAGGASQRAGLQQQAETYFDQSEQQAPGTLQQLLGQASLYAAAGEFDRAVRLLQPSTSEGSEQYQPVSDYLLTLIHMRQGNLEAADATAQRLQQHEETAVSLNLRGVVALLRADTRGARALFERARETEPSNVPAMLNLARVALAENDGTLAERHLRQALDVNPAQPEALIGLAQFAMARGNFTEARALLARAPESPMRMGAAAELSVREGRFDEAAKAFAQLFALQPSEVIALRAYEAARRAGHADAEAPLRQWHADHPDDIATNFALANAALEASDLEEAARHHEAVIARNARHAVTLNNLAWIYGERNDPRAIELGERAIAADPDNPSIADTVGWLYVRNGDSTRGLPLLARAAAALPNHPDVNYHWAVALANSGDRAEPIKILERITGDGAEFESREEAVRRLNDLRGRPP